MNIASRIAAWFGGKKLPYKRRLACLHSTGTQYIDTGIKFSGEYEVYIRVFIEKDDISGALIYFGNNDPQIWITSGTIRFSNTNTFEKTASYRVVGAYNEFTLNEKTLTLNGQVFEMSKGSFGGSATIPAYLFRASNRSSNVSKNLRISDWSVKKNGELIQKFIPVIDLNDRPAMYDEVSGEFFYNQGTGEFGYEELPVGGGYKCLISSLKSLWRRFSRVLRNASKEVRV